MSDDLKNAALNAVQRKSRPIDAPSPPPQKNLLYKDYYDLETHEPIPLETISRRVKKRFADIDRNSAYAMMDLFFMKNQWGFYSREESFSSYVKNELKISRTHAYSILNSIELLSQYFNSKEKDLTDFMTEITSSIEEVGVKKLSILAKLDDEQERNNYLERLIKGEKITVDSLLKKGGRKKSEKSQSTIKIEEDALRIDDSTILTFQTDETALRKAVEKAVAKYIKAR